MRLDLAGHPLHPALVHFPLALWYAAVFWDAVGWWRAEPIWSEFAYWSLALGLLLALPAIASGVLDFLALGPEHPGLDTAARHMLAMLAATAAFGASWVVRAATDPGAPSAWAIGLALVGSVLLGVGGWLGGTLVYRYGAGRRIGT
ncbi:MAG TPA: DUF2231 domain-containing protein [Burkholderiales bacterium]